MLIRFPLPFTPYHIGPNGFVGLALRRWVDPAVIILANVAVDLEVLFAPGFPEVHRHWHFHTFLVGSIVGAAFGLVCWFFKPVFSRAMNLLRISYKPRLWKMMLAGALGVCLHVLVDSFYHWDVQPLWPFSNRNIFWRLLKHGSPDVGRGQVVLVCNILFYAAIVLYAFAVIKFNREKNSIAKESKK